MGLLDLLNQSFGQDGGLLSYLPFYQNQTPTPSFQDRFAAADPAASLNDRFDASFKPSARDFNQGQFDPSQYAPSASFADRFSAAPGAPDRFAPSGRNFNQGQFDTANYAPPSQQPAQPPQASPIAIGDYMMPRIGAASAYEPQQASIPRNAQMTQGQMPGNAQPPSGLETPPAFLQPSSPGGFGGALRGAMANMSNGPLGLIGGALAGGLGMGQGNPQDIARQNMKAQYDALRQTLQQSGMSPQEASSKAMLAVINPEAGKTILGEALTSKEEFKVIKDALGAEHGYWVNNRDQTVRPAEGGGGSGGALGQGPSLLAPGVKDYNASLTGGDYLNQFGPEVKAAVHAYINGDVMPSGNPRTQAIATKAKEIAIKYGADMGIPVSDSLYAEKRKYRTELGTNSPNSAGGQAKAFNQGIDHLSHLATTLEKLDNSNGMGIPMVASGVNAVRQGVSNDQASIADKAKTLGQTVAGEVGKLFSGSAGGGVHERELTRERFDTVKSKPQLAAALSATIETMQGGLHALEQRRDSIMGPNSGIELVDQATRQKIEQIQGVIDRLEGKGPAQAPKLPSGWELQVR